MIAKTSEPPTGTSDLPPVGGAGPTRRLSPASHARAFVATLAGVGDVPPDDPHRAAKWAAGITGLIITGIFVWGTVTGHRGAHRAGYAAGKASAAKRAALPARRRSR